MSRSTRPAAFFYEDNQVLRASLPPKLSTYPHTFAYQAVFIRQAQVECGEGGMVDVLDIRTAR
jgi:hypothetical protein